MSVNYQVNVVERLITAPVEEFIITGDLTSFVELNIFSRSFGASNTAANPNNKRNFDFAFGTSGAVAGEQIFASYRSVAVPEFIQSGTPLFIPNFFEDVGTDDDKLHVIQRFNKNGEITYDIFHTSTTPSGSTDYDLTIATVSSPPDQLQPLLSTPAAPVFTKAVPRKVGNEFFYDYFLLSINS